MSSIPARPRPSTVTEHLAGTKDSWHGKIMPEGPFKPERDRYHLYIGLFCPFAHRVNLVRYIKNLTTVLPISVVLPYPKGDLDGWPGWKFPSNTTDYAGANPDELFQSQYLHEIYFKADEKYQGRYSVPVLWDKKTGTIVNNESAELLRDLPTAFSNLLEEDETQALDLYPRNRREEIDEIAEWMQRDLNTGVYKAGFAPTQKEYDANVILVFAALNSIEKTIAANKGPFVLGRQLTELDLRLYATIIRFDVVYVQHFKCNLGTIRANYPQIHNWMKGLYWGSSELEDGRKVWGFGEETVEFRHIKENYTKSHGDVNPKAITPKGPWPDVEQGFERDFGKIRVGGVKTGEEMDYLT